jgi:polyisoprenoid-binding protein YceI
MQAMKLSILATLLFFMGAAQAEYQLNNAESSLDFITIKKHNIGEVQTFTQLSGHIKDSGDTQITIDLASVHTNIAIRDVRIKKLLLETGSFPTARVSAHLDTAQLDAMTAGDVLTVSVALTLDLHGKSNVLNADVRVVKLANGGLLVSTIKPIILNAFDYGLHEGIQRIIDLTKLSAISLAVPVSFNLSFAPND